MADIGGIAGDALKAYIERIERLEEEKAAIAADIREIYSEAKGNGFDPKIMRQVYRMRKMDSADREEQEYLVEIYKRALGMGHTLDDDAAGAPAAGGQAAGGAAPETGTETGMGAGTGAGTPAE